MRLPLVLLIWLSAVSTASADESSAGVRRHDLKSHSASMPRIIVQHRGKPDIQVVETSSGSSASELQSQLRKLQKRSDVTYAVLDQRRQAHAIPSDAWFASQWSLQDAQPSAIAANLAWDVTTGGNGTVVAVLDSGVRFDHPDLQRAAQAGKLLPGFDFVSGESTSSFLVANDGDGWDSDPSDPGDWVDSNDRQQTVFANCSTANSSWHGTRVAGLIGAASNNGIGIAGASWGALILPVRVLGKCGGHDRDILPAMRWAAGISVSGIPDNPHPAKILNLSFGSPDPCNAAYQSLLRELAEIGVSVVISAGNEGGPVDAPANCPLAIGVAGLRHVGTKVGYSSLGPEVTIAAPAGNCFNLSGPCLFSLHTTYDVGATSPAGSDYTNQINTNLGTSFSAPLVAGVAALMHDSNGRLSPAQLRARLQESARAFPVSADPTVPACRVPAAPNDFQLTECNCTTATCGAGMLHAPSAVAAALRPIAAIAAPTTFTAGSTIMLDAAASAAACNRSIAAYQWSLVSVTDMPPPVLADNNQSSLQVNAPLSGSYTLRLTITDNQGAVDNGDVEITSTSSNNNTAPVANVAACPTAINVSQQPTPPLPVTPPSSSGGGGASSYWVILLISLAGWKQKPAYRYRA